MKSLRWLCTLCLAVPFAHADVVMEQKIESAAMNGVMVLKVKGNQARMETPTPAGQVIIIMDMTSGKATTLMTAQKIAMTMDLGAMKKQAEAAQKASGVDPATIKPVATGNKAKVGDWDAEEYVVTSTGLTMHIWVAPKFPDAAALKAELTKLAKAANTGLPDANSFDLPGMVVKTDADTQMGKFTTTVQSAKIAPVDASEFVIPSGYNMMQAPAGFGGGTGAGQ